MNMPMQKYREMNNRKNKAKKVLQTVFGGVFSYLGEGKQGVVYHNRQYVFKVFLDDCTNSGKFKSEMVYLQSILPLISQSDYLYPVTELREVDGVWVLVYPYEQTTRVDQFRKEDLIGFLAELWKLKLVMLNIKPENFVMSGQQLRLIDYEFVPYTDNLFLNVCVRAFISIRYGNKCDSDFLIKLNRSAINNFSLSELDGVQEFVNDIYGRIIFQESKHVIPVNEIDACIESEIIGFDSEWNPEKIFFCYLKTGRYLSGINVGNINCDSNNYLSPDLIQLKFETVCRHVEKVSLLIKTCVQDVNTIEQNIKHIVRQLCSPDLFYEILVSVDSKESNFLREYCSAGDHAELSSILNRLQDEQVIDRWLLYDETHSAEVNKRWFNQNSVFSHSVKNAPVASQLYAFEQLKGDYILQMDADVIITRRNYKHSFLNDMLDELKKNNSVVSVGFNICQQENQMNPYSGFEGGGFVPEVRFGLFHKKRLFALRPFFNEVNAEGLLKLSWFRALHITQKEKGFCSLRGGSPESFYIHPQNYRKTNPDSWLSILDRAEQGFVPEIQFGEFDCMGSLYDWSIPKRNAKMVIICLLRDICFGRFLRMWYSVLSQTFSDWEMVIVDDLSTNGLPFFIENTIAAHRNRVTFIKNRYQLGGMANLYKAIHYFVSNPESIIVTVDGDDALIGNNALQDIYDKYRLAGADLVIGRVYQNYRLQPHYRYPANFVNPRKTGGNVWQHTRSFKKYLFDGLELSDLKFSSGKDVFQQFSAEWITLCSDFAYMVPMVEMSSNPMQMDCMNYFYERTELHTPEMKQKEEDVIAEVLQRPAKTRLSPVYGRKRFVPNTERIEIDITYACNLKCIGCNRSCAQAPTTTEMHFEQIKSFVNESKTLNKHWKIISLLGGEPTLHSAFKEIVYCIVNEYIREFSPETVLKIVSNGYTAKSREILQQLLILPEVYVDWNSFKTDNSIPYFSDFNDAPIDDKSFEEMDFSKGCWVTAYCGVNLNQNGYFACSLCAGIDRVMQAGKGIGSLTELSGDRLKNQLSDFCRYCGNYKSYEQSGGSLTPRSVKAPFQNRISASWVNIYDKFQQTTHHFKKGSDDALSR